MVTLVWKQINPCSRATELKLTMWLPRTIELGMEMSCSNCADGCHEEVFVPNIADPVSHFHLVADLEGSGIRQYRTGHHVGHRRGGTKRKQKSEQGIWTVPERQAIWPPEGTGK